MLQPCFHPVMDIPATARELAQLARLFLHCGIPLTALVQVSCITTLLQLVNWQLTRLFFLPGANVVILPLTQSTLYIRIIVLSEHNFIYVIFRHIWTHDMVHTGLMTFYSKTFQGLLIIFKESISTGTISHFFCSHSKKAIPVRTNVVQPKDRIL